MRLPALLCLLAACGPKDWREAVRDGSSTAYAAYAARHPGTPRAAAAARRAPELAWAEAQALDTSIAYASYLAAYPEGEHAAEAKVRGVALAWTEAKQSGSVATLASFLARYPDSPHEADAEQLLEQLWYDEAKQGGTEVSWGRYLVRYPQGTWAEEAARERERLAWEATVPQDTIQAYLSFVQRYPDGAHAAEARAWLDATRVAKLQPVVVLAGTWQGDRSRATVVQRVRGEVERGLLADLKRFFTVLPVKVVDPRGAPLAHPHEAWGATEGVGLLVLEYTEVAGRTFEPSGHATDITATLRLYAPNTRTPVLDKATTASTPARILGADASSLHTSAVKDLGARLRAYAQEIEGFGITK